MNKIRESYNKLINGEDPKFAIWGLFSVGIIILIGGPYFLIKKSFTGSFDFSDTGQIGDTIGGITTPLLTMLGAFLTFIAFWIQVKANKTQTQQFKKQDLDTKRERFENKFYELLKLHRENVAEMDIEDEVFGRKCFIHMFNELRFVYCLTNKLYELSYEEKTIAQKLSEREIFNISYLIYFYGVGNKSDKAINELLQKINSEFISKVRLQLHGWQKAYTDRNIVISIPHTNGGVCELKLKYLPFEGHTSRLGHYYRHLFGMSMFVLEQDDLVITNKFEYINTIRSQLSTQEQLLLYYNSLSILGENWIGQKLMTKYRMIKNIPLPYADISISPRDKFGEKNELDEYIFEWDIISQRL